MLLADEPVSPGERAPDRRRREEHSPLRAAMDSPIRELKSAVLAIDWEITDSILLRFNEEINELQEVYRGDAHVLRLLRLLGVVGKYIRKRRAEAHPMSIRLLHGAYESLEQLVLEADTLSKEYKTERVSQAFAALEQLKNEVRAGRKREDKATSLRERHGGGHGGEVSSQVVELPAREPAPGAGGSPLERNGNGFRQPVEMGVPPLAERTIHESPPVFTLTEAALEQRVRKVVREELELFRKALLGELERRGRDNG